MKVLYCAAEAAPLVKIGGLGDVAGSLPKALADLGCAITVVLPDYAVINTGTEAVHPLDPFAISVDGKDEKVSVRKTNLPGSHVPVILLGNDSYLKDGGKSAFAGSVSEADRFTFFSKAIAKFIKDNPEFDIIHLNDWHVSLVPIFMAEPDSTSKSTPKIILTVHNVAYQGITDVGMILRFDLTKAQASQISFENAKKDINCLKQGLLKADFINTVSENYAQELQTIQFGGGLESIFQTRANQLSGILNGIDYEIWNPAADKFLAQLYPQDPNLEQLQAAKSANKKALLSKLKLPENRPLVGFVGRIEPKQKGIDLIVALLDQSDLPFQLVILGTGDKTWEATLQNQADKNPNTLSVNLFFDETMAHQIYAGCDFLLMPSKFEPGGLPQMIGQHYGTLPIVHSVGGLKDTVHDLVDGFAFGEYSLQSMQNKIDQALRIYATETYWQMAQTAINLDHSWHNSARQYLTLYTKALGNSQA